MNHDEKSNQDLLEQVVTELGYEALKAQQKKIDTLSLDQLRALIAYETWKDGQDDWSEVNKIWLGVNDFNVYNSRESIMNELVNTYGY